MFGFGVSSLESKSSVFSPDVTFCNHEQSDERNTSQQRQRSQFLH